MDIQRGDSWWQLRIEVRRQQLRKVVTYIKDRSEIATVWLASLAFLVGIITVFYSWMWPLRMGLSLLTLISAVTVISRVVVVEPDPRVMRITTPELSIIRQCPECGADLDENPDSCSNCRWESDNPINE